MIYLAELEVELEYREAERKQLLERAMLHAKARSATTRHPLLARTGHLLTRAGTRLEAWAEPRPARPALPIHTGSLASKKSKVATPC